MYVLSIILARAGSKGVPGKCLKNLCGRAVIEYTFDHALDSIRSHAVVLTTDCVDAAALARRRGIEWIPRPPELATDTAAVDDAARHAVTRFEQRHHQPVDVVALLYANIPVRPEGLVDRAIDHLVETGADSVRTLTPVGKHHPDWMYRLEGDRMAHYRQNCNYRRQDLEPLYALDGALAIVTRSALFDALHTPGDKQAFLGRDRRAIVLATHETVDIDEPIDLYLAEAILRMRTHARDDAHLVAAGQHTPDDR